MIVCEDNSGSRSSQTQDFSCGVVTAVGWRQSRVFTINCDIFVRDGRWVAENFDFIKDGQKHSVLKCKFVYLSNLNTHRHLLVQLDNQLTAGACQRVVEREMIMIKLVHACSRLQSVIAIVPVEFAVGNTGRRSFGV